MEIKKVIDLLQAEIQKKAEELQSKNPTLNRERALKEAEKMNVWAYYSENCGRLEVLF